jgi:beta-lactam-binding protein with PASTA domain
LRIRFGYSSGIADDRDTTQSFEPVPPREEPPLPPPPVDPRPPGMLVRDVWPWLALLGLLAVAGLLLWLFVFRGDDSKGKVVPAVVGMQQQQAISRLTEEGFGVRAIIGPADKPRGIVVSQAPGGGSRLDKGQVVTLHISNGHAIKVVTTTTKTTTTKTETSGTTTTATPSTAAVPDVTGQDMVSAAGQVEAAGFVAETGPDETASGTPGSIVSQDPAAGTEAEIGSVVALSVAIGSNRPEVAVPNVVGEKSAAARATLLGAKLTVKTEYKKGPAKNVGVVAAEAPTGSVPAYTQITITVGS